MVPESIDAVSRFALPKLVTRVFSIGPIFIGFAGRVTASRS